MSRIAIVAALEREVRPLIKKWSSSDKEYGGRNFRFFENVGTVVVCGGIGAESARRAAEAIIALYQPQVIYSVGFAGALDQTLRIGDTLQPRRVVNAADGSSLDLGQGAGVLVTFGAVASAAQKARLRESFSATAVDMEAAAVARAAEARGIGFGVLKVISDDATFTFPVLEQFVGPDGRFSESRFALFIALRPWLWAQVARLAQNSRRASRLLCEHLRKLENGLVSPPATTQQGVNRR
jgi:adenosylhomocysteine nucleosidase